MQIWKLRLLSGKAAEYAVSHTIMFWTKNYAAWLEEDADEEEPRGGRIEGGGRDGGGGEGRGGIAHL